MSGKRTLKVNLIQVYNKDNDMIYEGEGKEAENWIETEGEAFLSTKADNTIFQRYYNRIWFLLSSIPLNTNKAKDKCITITSKEELQEILPQLVFK